MPTKPVLDIAHFTLRSIVFELRYPHAFLLFDRLGIIASQAKTKWPELKPENVLPNQLRFSLARRLEFGIELERAFVAIAGTKLSVEEMTPFATFLAEYALSELEVTSLNRVGLRITYIREYKTMPEAVSGFFESNLVRRFDGKIFGTDGNVELPNFSIRFEGAYIGCTAILQVRKRAFNVEIPFIGEEELEPMTREHIELVFECDYSTTQAMRLAQLNTARWMEETMRVVRRDSGAILAGIQSP